MFRYLSAAALLVCTLALTSLALAANEGQTELDRATDLNLKASTLADFDKVIELLDSAIKKGLDEGNTQFANSLLSATLVRRGESRMAAVLRGLPPEKLAKVRTDALADFERAVKVEPKQAQAWLHIAQLERLPGGDVKKAAAALEQAIQVGTDPEVKAKSFLLRATMQEDDTKRLADLDEAVKLAPGEAAIVRARAIARADAGKYEEAIADLDRALEIEPGHEPTFEAKALVLVRMKKFKEAVETLELARKSNPQSLAPLLQLARIHSLQSDVKAAIADLDEALKLEPRNVAVLLLRATLQEDKDKKEADLDAAVKADPESTLALRTRAIFRADSKRVDDAIADLNAAIDLQPKEIPNHEAKALVLWQAKEYARALAAVDRLLDIDPKLITAMRLRAMVLADSGKREEAVKLLEKLYQENPVDRPTALLLASMFVQDKKYQKALDIYSALLAKEADEPSVLRARADALLHVGKHAEAVLDYETILKEDPEDSGTLNNLAWTLATSPVDKVRDGKRAVKLATTACELTKYKAPHILSTLAAAYAETGDFATAIKWVEQGIELGNAEEKASLAKELESYKQSKPYRELLTDGEPSGGKKDVDMKDVEKKTETPKSDK